MATCVHEVATADTGNTPNTSGAFTPGAGDLLIVFVTSTASVTEADASLTSSVAGQSFKLVRAASQNSSANRLLCYVAELFSTAVSQTVAFAPADTATGSNIWVYSITGMARRGLSAIRQSAEEENGAATGTPAPAFAVAALTGNPTLGAVMNNSNPAGMTPPTNWTEGAADIGHATPDTGQETVFRDSGFTGQTITWGSASPTAFASLIVELDTTVPVEDEAQPVIGQWPDARNVTVHS